MKHSIKRNQTAEMALLATVMLTAICAGSLAGPARRQSDQAISERAAQIVGEMSPDERVGQLFLVYWSTRQPSQGLKQLIATYEVGSVLIWSRNFLNSESPTAAQQVAELTNELQTYAWEANKKTSADGTAYFVPLFLAADHEGDGPRYTRIRSGMTAIPSPLAIGATWSPENAEQIGQVVGRELSAIGVNMIFGPVVDVVDEPGAQGFGNLDVRVFGGDPHWVGELGRAYIRGLHRGAQGKIITVAKHFPGHGDSNRATDNSVAVTHKTLQELLDVDLVPFLRVTQRDEGDSLGRTDALMSSHIAIADTGAEPVSLYYDERTQRGGITALLEEAPGFRDWYVDGFVVADSLGVGAIRNRYTPPFPAIPIATDAFLAGNDLLILHNFFGGKEGEVLSQDDSAQQNMREVIEYFRKRYKSDASFAGRVDQAARKIVSAKLRLYPQLALEAALVDASNAEIPADSEGAQTIDRIAEQAITLLWPSTIERLPPPPAPNEKIVFVVHNVGAPSCEKCIDDWRPLKRDNLANFLIQERSFPADPITSVYYYRDRQTAPAGLTTFLYGFWLETGLAQDAITPDEAINIELPFAEADWIIFAMLTGDCGPDAPQGDCLRGREEADTLHLFLDYVDSKKDMRAKIVAIAFGAPPWRLDSTDASRLDMYYGAFNQLEPFQRQAMRAVLQEFIPQGASPIDVDAVNYHLENVLAPDPLQIIGLEVVNRPPKEGWQVGDTVEVRITGIVDKNGHPVVDGTPVTWQGKREAGDAWLGPRSSSTGTLSGEASATFSLTHPGRVDFSARIAGWESEHLSIEVQDLPVAPSATLNLTAAITETPVFVAGTPSAAPAGPPIPGTGVFDPLNWLAENVVAIMVGLLAPVAISIAVAIRWRVEYEDAKTAAGAARPGTPERDEAEKHLNQVKDLRSWLFRFIASRYNYNAPDPKKTGSLEDRAMGQTSILFLAADPSDLSRLRLGEEFREIQEQLKMARERDRLKLELPQMSVRARDISQALLDTQPQIVHFSGHATPEGALCFEDRSGHAQNVKPEALAALFEQFSDRVNCVLLNACYSEVQARAIARHIAYVIGMNQAVGDRAAIAFAVGFYQALGANTTIEEAYKLGCVQIGLQDIPEYLTPVMIRKPPTQS